MAMLIDNLEVAHIKKCFLTANGAEAVPPLGTILGNLGVNTVKFCEEFNTRTKNLPIYFIVKTYIYILDNRSFRFEIGFPSTSYILNFLKFEKTIKVKVFDRVHDKEVSCILLSDVVELAKFKFPHEPLEKSVPVIWGSVKSMDLLVVSKNT